MKAGSYRADQVGSLLRPPELLKARADYAEGKIPLEDLRQEEDRAILDVLHLQRQIGLDVLTDGEYRRGAWMTDMASAVEGFVKHSALMRWKGSGGGDEPSASHVVGSQLRPRRRLTAEQSAFLKKHAAGHSYKMTIPSPSGFMISSYRPQVSGSAYPSAIEMGRDLAAIVHDEVAALVAEGVGYVQLDTPQYSYFGDPAMAGDIRQSGLAPNEALDAAIDVDNACLEGIDRRNLTVAMHVCRGNSRGRWVAEGGYDAFADKLFNGLDVDRFLLEYDSDRAGGFEALRFVPPPKTVVLGLVSTKEQRLETKDELCRRIDQAAKYIPAERLALSPQCGFASVAAGNLVDWDDQRRKLELVVETAREVWGAHS
jgi:5-methyltetrahydropteroyltriglutamate--homocysteine methyltransferase